MEAKWAELKARKEELDIAYLRFLLGHTQGWGGMIKGRVLLRSLFIVT